MKQYYADTSVLLVYTLASGAEVERYPVVHQLFDFIENKTIRTSKGNLINWLLRSMEKCM